MQPTRFSRQLEHMLPDWVARGWVSGPHQQALLDDAAARSHSRWNLPGVIAILGTILLFVGVISYVASNWPDLDRVSKLLILFAGMFISFIAAWRTEHHYHAPAIGAALALLGTLFFGSNIMLIAQIYHLQADPPAGALMWALGALAVAALWQSQLVAGLGFILTGVWNYMAVTEHMNWLFNSWSASPHFPSLLLLAVFTGLSLYKRWNGTAHLAGIGLILWCLEAALLVDDQWVGRFGGLTVMAIISVLYLVETRHGHLRHFAQLTGRYAWVLFGLWLAIITIPEAFIQAVRYSREGASGNDFTIGMSVAVLTLLGGLYTLLFTCLRIYGGALCMAALVGLFSYLPVLFSLGGEMTGYDTTRICAVLLGLLTVAATIGMVIRGSQTDERFFVNFGLTMFAIKIMILYFDTFGSMHDKSMFFLGGGALVVALSVLLERQRRRLTRKIEGAV